MVRLSFSIGAPALFILGLTPAQAQFLNDNCKFEVAVSQPEFMLKKPQNSSETELVELEPVSAWQRDLIVWPNGLHATLDEVLNESIECQDRNEPRMKVVQTTAKEKVDRALAPYEPQSKSDFMSSNSRK